MQHCLSHIKVLGYGELVWSDCWLSS